jgi:hypothetical protein
MKMLHGTTVKKDIIKNIYCCAWRIFRKWEGVIGTGWSWLRIGTGGGHL